MTGPKGMKMARLVQVVLEDDIEGGAAEETVQFGLDGVSYEIDLNEANAAALRASLEQYVEFGRRVRGRTSRRSGAASSGAVTGRAKPSDVRAWAEANGIAVSARGRIPADVIAQYEAAHG